MVIGRLKFDVMNIFVNIEGVLIKSGDVIVVDGDGVVVVLCEFVYDVYSFVKKEFDNDKVLRRKLYDFMGWEYDEIVR